MRPDDQPKAVTPDLCHLILLESVVRAGAAAVNAPPPIELDAREAGLVEVIGVVAAGTWSSGLGSLLGPYPFARCPTVPGRETTEAVTAPDQGADRPGHGFRAAPRTPRPRGRNHLDHLKKGMFVKKGNSARAIALACTSVTLWLGLSALGASGCAAVTGDDAMRESTSITVSNCDFPTSVRPDSTYVTSFGNCYLCLYEEVSAHARYPWRDYYCTYNPDTDLNDLHYILKIPGKGA
ncbi:hypothetical protein AB0F88_09745 [Streptosporangium sp. NPDC023963]|uniref:hypothetical protein n=1 Tax=Streptosporangium sp. NPDC023963 TaxID=3155608 RepID=UPI00343E3F4F